ncbi:SprB repeat-containing protein, partial [Belliella pelovolcani]|uniref:SprB repeat-containing protein n=1 Tax=Belliella pelovolcani TaxID=529505 RepID=UPI00391D10D5
MEKIYRIAHIFLLLMSLATLFNKSLAQSLIQDIYSIRECEKTAEYRVRGGVPPYTYVWTFEGNEVQVDANLDPTQTSILTQAQSGTYTVTVTDSDNNSRSATFVFSESSNFILDIEILEDQECEGTTFGRIIGNIENGIAPFSINIFNDQNVLVNSVNLPGRTINLTGYPAGTYLIEVIDANGCIELTEVELEEIEPIEFEEGANLGAFPVTCEDNGSIAFNVLDAAGEVRFRIRRASGGYVNPWTVAPGGQVRYDGLPVGDYILEISDDFRFEDCPEELPFSIVDEVLLLFDASPTAITCFGENDGSILFEVSRNFTDISPLPNEVFVTITNSSNTVIYDNISVSIGAADGDYLFENLQAGTYTITTRHGGIDYPECIQSFTVTINGPDSPISANITKSDIACFGVNSGSATAVPSGGWGDYTFLWSNGATTSQINNLAPGEYWVDITDDGGCTIRREVEIIGPPAEITADVNVLQNLTCAGSNDGIAEISNIQGGYGGYTIQWGVGNQSSATAVDLPAGSISVTVTDSGGCSRTFNVVITAPPAPNLIIDENNVTCFGGDDGSVRIQVSGSDSYTISVAGQTQVGNDVTFNGLQAGNYVATISYGVNCNISRNITIGSPSRVIINRSNVQLNNISCFGQEDGSILGLTASGGTGLLSVQWQEKISDTYQDITGANSLNLTDLGIGEYKIIVTDENGCFDEYEYAITEPNPLNVSSPTTTPVTCFNGTNGSVSFTVSGGRTPYAYSLNGGAFTLTSNGNITIPNLPAGTGNTIEVRDNSGCTVDNFTFDINTTPPIQLDFVASYQETCFGQQNGSIEINIGGGSGNLKVEWYRAGDFSTVISTNQNLSNVGPGDYTVRVIDLLEEFCYAQQTFSIAPTPDINLALDGNPTNILCFGEETGAININASGGTGTLTYSWTGPNGFTSNQQNISDIGAGLYRVRVTDSNGCFKELVDILVEQPDTGIQISTLNTTAPSCPDSDDGAIQMQVFGGAPAYNISWQRLNSSGDFEGFPGTGLSLTGIPAGMYKILVSDANGCSAEREIDLVGPDELIINVTDIDDVSCFGRNDGRINIAVSGGTFPYSYNWDHGFINQNATNLSAGFYAVTVTDARGCVTRLENIEVAQPAPIEINLIDTQSPTCEFDDGRIEVEFIGGDASFSSTWYRLPENDVVATNTAFLENITPGVYRVEYGNGSICTASRIITLAGPASPLQLNISAQDPTCDNDNGIIAISASGGSPGYQFFIEVEGDQTPLTSNIIANLAAGNYLVTVRDSQGCEVTRAVDIQNPNQPIYDIEKIQDVSCFGGNDGVIHFETFGDFTGITFQWFKREFTGVLTPTTEAQLDELEAGTYFVRFTYDNACTIDSEDIIISEPSEIVITTQIEQLVCFDDFGRITIQVNGGSAGKTLTLSGPNSYINTVNDIITGSYDFENLVPGVYTWTVEDVGCGTQSGILEISAIQRPEFDLSQVNILCFGDLTGSITVINIILETNRTYNVFLNGINRGVQTNFNNLPAGSYSIQLVDSQGCESSIQTIEITQPDRPLEILNLLTENTTCFEGNDGKVSFEILGGTAPYSFSLNGNNGYSVSASEIDPLSEVTYDDLRAGSYTIEVLDENGNCQAIATFQIAEPTDLIFDIEVGQIACPGGTTFIRLFLSGGTTPYSYTWEKLDTDTGNWELLTETSNQLQGIAAGSYRYSATDANNCEVFSEIVEIPDGLAVAIDFTADDILCFGGNTLVNLSASRPGSSNFTFFVNGNQIFGNTFPAIAGAYQVYALDNINGCISEEITISINQPDAPLSYAGFTSTQLSCFESNDGEISFSLAGGTAPYTITFLGATQIAQADELITFSGLEANIPYGFTIEDNNGCLLTIPPVVLTQPFPIQVNSTFTPIQCYDGDGSIIVQATGGRAPFSILWEYAANGVDFVELDQFEDLFSINGLKAGTYKYTLSDNGGCPPVVESIVLDQPSETVLDFTSTEVSCFQGNDGTISFSPSGGPASSYQIYFNGQLINGTEVSGLSAGTFEAFAVSGGCPSEVISITISQPEQALGATLTYPTAVLCHNDFVNIQLDIFGGNGEYEAAFDGTFVPVGASGNIIFEDLLPGTYTLEVRDQKGCFWSEIITITNPLPIEINQA